jgi:hypothetical protein
MLLFLVLAPLVLATGCASYRYQIIEPASVAHTIIYDRPVVINYDPLQYQLSRFHDQLGMTIINPTTDRITLRGDHSYVVDPKGETHPVRGRVLAPHSYAKMLWPPPPTTAETVYPSYFGPGWAPGYPYVWGGFYGSYYGPVVTYYHAYTAYDWKWDPGEAHMHLAYERQGKEFNHDFLILREREK